MIRFTYKFALSNLKIWKMMNWRHNRIKIGAKNVAWTKILIYSKTRIFSAVRVEAERWRKTIFHLETAAWKTSKEKFLRRIWTWEEKWIHNHNCKKEKILYQNWWIRSISVYIDAKISIHYSKAMHSTWWNQTSVVYYELLQQGETIAVNRYRLLQIHLSRVLCEKRPKTIKKLVKMILLHENARLHVGVTVKNYLETPRWKNLFHPPYAPDFIPTDSRLFWRMQNNFKSDL